MSDTTAPREYCDHCGRELGPIRAIIVGSNAKLHLDCVAPWRSLRAPKEPADTSNHNSYWTFRP